MYTISYNPSDERASFSNFHCKTGKSYGEIGTGKAFDFSDLCVWRAKFTGHKRWQTWSLAFKIKSLLVNAKVCWGFQFIKSWRNWGLTQKLVNWQIFSHMWSLMTSGSQWRDSMIAERFFFFSPLYLIDTGSSLQKPRYLPTLWLQQVN